MIAGDITKRYAPFESWFYDRFIADAVLFTTRGLLDQMPAAGLVLEVGSGGGQLALHLAEHSAEVRECRRARRVARTTCSLERSTPTIWTDLPLSRATVERVPGDPTLLISGTKRS